MESQPPPPAAGPAPESPGHAVPAPRFHGENWLQIRLWHLKRDARDWLRRHGLEIWVLVGLWMLVSLITFVLASGHESPRRYQDEFLFWGVAKSFAGGDGLTWRGEGIGLYYFMYPVLLAPAFWIGSSVAASYTIVHLINSLMMAGVVFPAYFMARQMLGKGPAALAAVMAVSVPAMNYAGVIGTESLAYPVCVAAFGGMILSIARPRRRNWLLALGLIVMAVFTRAQFAVLAPVYFAALIFAGLMRERAERSDYIRVQREPLAVLIAGFAMVGVLFLIKGHGVVGLYAGVFEGVSPTFDDVWYWVKGLTADVYVFTAVIPAVALLAMFMRGENRRDPFVGALLAVTLIATIAFIAEVTWFSAINPYNWRIRNIFYERYMFYLGPLYFTALFVAWKRVSVMAALFSSVLAVIAMKGFQTDSVLIPFSYDAFGMTLIGWYMDGHANVIPNIGRFLAGITALLTALYCISRIERSYLARLFGIVTITIVFSVLLVGQGWTWHLARMYSHDAFRGVPKPANFIDRNADEDVGMVITYTDSPEMYFTTEFWNDRVTRMFATDAVPIKTPIMYSPRCTFDWSDTGQILGTGCDKVPSAFYLRNDTIAMHLRDEVKRVHPTPEYSDITLMVARPPARMFSLVDGRNVITGEVQNVVNVRSFLDHPGALRMRFAESDRSLAVSADGGRRFVVPAGEVRVVEFPVRAGKRITTVRLKSQSGVPEVGKVLDMQLREAGGQWTSIR
ncbi:MAG: glycosyltransferase family 39 protein [Actinobacteria bacterium]|nr:glycosyltransferase family 39 protein [Actinomycetota bacterium]